LGSGPLRHLMTYVCMSMIKVIGRSIYFDIYISHDRSHMCICHEINTSWPTSTVASVTNFEPDLGQPHTGIWLYGYMYGYISYLLDRLPWLKAGCSHTKCACKVLLLHLVKVCSAGQVAMATQERPRHYHSSAINFSNPAVRLSSQCTINTQSKLGELASPSVSACDCCCAHSFLRRAPLRAV